MKVNKNISRLSQYVRKILFKSYSLAFMEIDGVVLPKVMGKQTDEGVKEDNQREKQGD